MSKYFPYLIMIQKIYIYFSAILGISDLSLDEYYGCKTHLEPGEVPVFWACGVTGLEALKSVSK